MGRAPCCDKSKVKRGPWSPQEDEILKNYLHNHGTGGNWIALPLKAGLKRCGKSCRLRWLNYLRPDIKHGHFTPEEDTIIFNLYSKLGSRWSVIASKLPGRTDNDVKNHWNTKLKKKLQATKDSYLATINQTPQSSNIPVPSTYNLIPKAEANYDLGFSSIDQGHGFLQGMPSNVGVLNYTQTGNNSVQEFSSLSDSTTAVDNNTSEFLMDYGAGFSYDQMMSTGIWNNNQEQMNLEALINLPTNSYANSTACRNVNDQFYGNY